MTRHLLEATTTAHRAPGHRGYLGAPAPAQANARQPMPGHRQWQGAGTAATRIDPAVRDAVLAERLRQALYEGCERAPRFTPAHRNLIGVHQ